MINTENANELNAELVADMQESGVAVPSLTTVNGQLAIRVAVVNHRTRREDMDIMLAKLESLAAARISSAGGGKQ